MNSKSNRRVFLQTTAGVCAASAVAISSSSASQVHVPRVDAHLHCFAGKNDSRFPYHPRGPYQPEPAATPEHLLDCMSKAGVDYSIVVHPEPYQDDHRYLEHCQNV